MSKKKSDGTSEELGTPELTVPAKVTKNALYFRQEMASGKATLHDGREVEIDACMNMNGDSVLIGVKVKGSNDWFTYVFMTNELIQASLQDFEKRILKE